MYLELDKASVFLGKEHVTLVLITILLLASNTSRKFKQRHLFYTLHV